MNSNKLGKAVTLLLALFFITYTLYQTFRFFFSHYQTENAYSFKVARVYTTDGIIIRDEHTLEGTSDGSIRYILPEGGKFIGTTPVAVRYSSEEAAEAAKLAELQRQERDVLEKAQTAVKSSYKPDIASLNDNIYTDLRKLALENNLGMVEDTRKLRLSLTENICKIQTTVDSTVNYDSKISKLNEAITDGESGTPITTGHTGYFSRFSDGKEDIFTPDMLESLTIEQLNQLIAQDYPYNPNAFGKAVTSYNWYYVTTVPISEMELFQPGVKMTLSFVGNDENSTVSGWVKSITEDKASNRALLVIQSDDISPDTVSRRTATVKLGFDDYRGVRFSKKALRISDGIKGIYVIGKSSIQFKRVDIIYTGTDFYLSKLDYDSNTYLNIFDEIIVEGTNLYDGKPLE